jgi:hypothetical protein
MLDLEKILQQRLQVRLLSFKLQEEAKLTGQRLITSLWLQVRYLLLMVICLSLLSQTKSL